MIISVEQLSQSLSKNENLNRGCIADTNVLFAATYDSDPFNEWALEAFDACKVNQIPVFTNLNIRSEFIELNRRVLMAEALMDFLDAWEGALSVDFENKLITLKRRIRDALKEKKRIKLADQEIKQFRKYFLDGAERNETPTWKWFCINHFKPYIATVWERAVAELKIQFLGTRDIESKEHFNDRPKWADMVNIIGESGIGTADAMILNLFLKSKFSMIVTADMDVSDAITAMEPPNKIVLAPT